jgi:hypothetical protein
MKRERNIIDLLKKISLDENAPEQIRREAAEALRNHERLNQKKSEEPR